MKLRKLSQSLKISLAMMVAVFSTGLMPASAAYATDEVTPNEGVCAGLDSGKIDTPSNPESLTITAPEGQLIDGYCVKAGSIKQGDGPEYVTVTPTEELTISHSSLKGISHYSVSYTTAPVEEETGVLSVSTDCEEITVSSSTITPADGVVSYEIDDMIVAEGATTVAAGMHTVELLVNDVVVATQTVEVQGCESDVTPAGSLAITTDCEEGTLGGTVIAPTGGEATYTVNGVETPAGTYTNLAPGDYYVEMFVDGVLVDSQTVTIYACEEPDTESVTLCHATGSTKNPFVRITVDAAGAYNGHLDDSAGGENGDHQNGEDIIPTFTYNGNTYSQNWTEGDTLPENCNEAEEVTPAAVRFINPTCENPNGRIVVTATEGVVYKVGSTEITGTTSYPAGSTVTVTASAEDESYILAEGAVTTWEHTFTVAPVGCVLGDSDVCPNLEGSQSMIPLGYTQNDTTGDCYIPTVTGGGRGGGQLLGAAVNTTLPAMIPSTGGSENPFMIVIASIIAYGAAYFLQGRRKLAHKLEA